jgi:hypothetical protein
MCVFIRVSDRTVFFKKLTAVLTCTERDHRPDGAKKREFGNQRISQHQKETIDQSKSI